MSQGGNMDTLVLLSGGLDSTVSLALAMANPDIYHSRPKVALTFNYGHLAAAAEIKAAYEICQYFKIKHLVLDLPWLGSLGGSALTSNEMAIPQPTMGDLNNYNQGLTNAKAVWVPNRNGVFANVAAAYAESIGIDQIMVGFNEEEAITFPDNSESFLNSVVHSFKYSTQNSVRMISPTLHLGKAEILEKGLLVDVPWQLIWVCYDRGPKMCGKCESCQRFKRAIAGLDVVAQEGIGAFA